MTDPRFGLGCGSLRTGEQTAAKESTKIIRSALDHGVHFFNTADFYGAGESEMAIGNTLTNSEREKVYLSLKFGALMAPSGAMYGLDVHPDRIKNYLTHSLKRMKLDYIDLYQPGRIDLAIPVEETIGAISDLVKDGYVREVGITQVDLDTLKRAHATHPLAYVEMEYSLFNRSMEQEILPTTRELGIPVVAFGIVAHGLLSGAWTKERVETGILPPSSHIELFNRGNIEQNILLVENLRKIAVQKHVTLSQLVHAWALTKGDDIIPLIGVSKACQFADSIQAENLVLSTADINQIENAVPQNKIAGRSFGAISFKNGHMIF